MELPASFFGLKIFLLWWLLHLSPTSDGLLQREQTVASSILESILAHFLNTVPVLDFLIW